jgi:hypothetical protein
VIRLTRGTFSVNKSRRLSNHSVANIRGGGVSFLLPRSEEDQSTARTCVLRSWQWNLEGVSEKSSFPRFLHFLYFNCNKCMKFVKCNDDKQHLNSLPLCPSGCLRRPLNSRLREMFRNRNSRDAAPAGSENR